MTQIIIIFAILVAILVLPVMFAARMVGAGNTGFGAALFAVILQLILSGLLENFTSNQFITVAIAVIGGSAIYTITLDTTLLKGILISIISVVIAFVVIVLLAGSFAVIGNVT